MMAMKTGSFAAPRRTRRRFLYRPRLESIETRLLLSNVYTVRNTSDAGPGSLREAINQANLNPGSTIDFDITLNAIDEFPITTANSDPQGITAGPDGNLWFTETQANQIGRITPDGVVTEFGGLTPGSVPTSITAGPDGNLWFTESNAGQIGKITPSGTVTKYALPNIGGSDTTHAPLGITLGPDHNLWFTDDAFILVSGLSRPSNAIGMITPAGNVTEYPIPTANGGPEFITTGPDGNLYFTENQGHAIGQITPSGTITEFPIANPNIAPVGITTGPDGALWFTFDESGTPGGIGRMTTSGAFTFYPLSTSNSSPEAITAGPDGFLYFTESGASQIGRISTSGTIAEFPIPTSSSAPFGIALGPDHNLWFTEQSANQVGRLVPNTNSTYTIQPLSTLPTITASVTIDATTQPGFAGKPIVELDGALAGNSNGLNIAASNTTVKGLVINRFAGQGIVVFPLVPSAPVSNVVIQGNYIGTDLTGTVALPNHDNGVIALTGVSEIQILDNLISGNGQDGVMIQGGNGGLIAGNWVGTDATGTFALGNVEEGIDIGSLSTGIVIGGATAADRNVVSANGSSGIGLGSVGNFTVSGNYVGTNAAGSAIVDPRGVPLGNALFGILLGVTTGDTVGGMVGGNIISGNRTSGVEIIDNSSQIQVQGNFIGTDVTGTLAMGNTGPGIVIGAGCHDITVGGPSAADRNIIAASYTDGGIIIFGASNVVQGNYIGTDITGEKSVDSAGHPFGNAFGIGIAPFQGQGGSQNLIGGLTLFNRNVIANSFGSGAVGLFQRGVGIDVITGANHNTIQSNLIGADATGTRALGNQHQGVLIQGDDNVVGGPSLVQCPICSTDNVIVGNGDAGVEIGPTSGGAGNVVQNNFIGLPALSSGPALGNGGDGIFIHGTATNTSITGNTVANNAGNGVDIQGTTGQALSTTVTSNSIRANALYGVQVLGATGNVIGGSTITAGNTISENRLGGIALLDTSNDQVLGNFIGTDSNGLQALGNGGPGVLIDASSHTIAIGGTSSLYDGNVIAANAGGGILLFGTANTIQGNRIGTDISGSKTVDPQGRSLGNPFGVAIAQQDGQGGFGNLIGGTEAGAHNIIAGSPGNASASGATGSGIALLPGTHDNAIQGNFIVANQDGILAFDSSTNLIGGVGAGVANTITFNANNGVSVQGNSLDDLILSNAIYANSSLGIAVAPTANGGIAPPVLTAAANFSGLTTVQGTYAGTPGTSYLLQFFANPPSDPGAGRVLIGSATVSTDSAGMALFSVAFPVGTGIFITATASRGGVGTSQFSTPVFISPLPFTVVNTNDSGPGSLRQAILNANLHPGVDTINFLIPGPGPYVIDLLSPVVVTDPAIIDGYTQPGARPNTLANGDNAVIPVVVDGSQAGQVGAGMIIEAGDTLVRGLVFQNFTGAGLALTGKGGDTVSGCFIGTDWTGTQAAGNGAAGLLVGEFPSSASASTAAPPTSGNVIGGASPADRDIISGNGGPGIYLFGGTTGNLIAGNLIGTDASGTRSLGNVTAGIIIGASDGPTAQNQIGGTTPGTRNIISGNNGPGVYLFGGTTGNLIVGNFIGTDPTGLIAVGNANIGVLITDSPNNVVGGLAPSAGNVISGNRAASPPSPPSANPNTTGAGGVVILGNASAGNQVLGNFIGTDVTGTAPLGNGYDGVGISGAPNNTVGGPAPGARNVIAGNGGVGVRIAGGNASGNVVQGNFIGTDVTGTAPLGNAFDGVYIDAAPNNTIGGTAPDAGNVISANHYSGIEIAALGATGNQVQGNLIGTSANGAGNLGNSGYGVLIQNTTGNTIGPGNVIANNGLGGFQVLLGGLPPTTTAGAGNTNTGNMFANNGAGLASTTARPRFRPRNFHQVPRSGAWGRRPVIHASLATHPVAMVHARFAPASDPLQASAVDAVLEAGVIGLDHRPRKPSSIAR
jgi:streptogramin lyase